MPRKRIPRIVFNQPPEHGHCITVKEWPYLFYRAYTHENGEQVLRWMTLCSRCGVPFEDESEFAVYWLHKRCPRHRRKQPTIEQKLAQAKRDLKRFLR